MSRYIEYNDICSAIDNQQDGTGMTYEALAHAMVEIQLAPSIDIVRCQDCKKSHIDGKTTHYLWCTEWGRSTDTFGYCERGEREGE